MRTYELCVTPLTKTSLEKSQSCHQTLAKGGKKNGSRVTHTWSRLILSDPRGARESSAPPHLLLWHDAAVWLPARGNLQEHRWKTEIRDSVLATPTLLLNSTLRRGLSVVGLFLKKVVVYREVAGRSQGVAPEDLLQPPVRPPPASWEVFPHG